MIHRVLLKKNLHDAKWLLGGCALTLFGFCWLRVWIVSRLDMARFQALLDLLPPDWRRFLPVDPDWLVTYVGRISLTYNEPIVMLCMSIWAIARGSDAVSGELGRGTMEILLAQPATRLQLLMSNAIVTVMGIGLIAAATWLGIYAGVQTVHVREEVAPTWRSPLYIPFVGREVKRPFAENEVRLVSMTEKVATVLFWPAATNLFFSGVMLAGVTTLVSACDRYRWRTIGVVVGIYLVQMVFKITAMSTTDLEWLRYGTILSAFEPEWMVRIYDLSPEWIWSFWIPASAENEAQFGPSSLNLLLLTFGAVGYALAIFIFRRRDLPAPV
jgi:ABC-2 type transport system permease protein